MYCNACTYICIYIYIYIGTEVSLRSRPSAPAPCLRQHRTTNLGTKILDFRGFDSSIILIIRGGILVSMGEVLESLSQESSKRNNLSRDIGCPIRGASAHLQTTCRVKHAQTCRACGLSCLHFSICACHPCAGAMLIFCASFHA